MLKQSNMTTGARTRLRIYVNDHRAGAAGGVSIARRCRDNNLGTALGVELQRIVSEIEEDATTLTQLAQRCSLPASPVKLALAWAGERAGRLKLNGQVRGYSPLSRLLELELLIAGIDAKTELWRSLGAAELPELAGVDFEALAARAIAQHEALQPHHDDAARAAFA